MTYAEQFANRFREAEATLRSSGTFTQQALYDAEKAIVRSDEFNEHRAPGSGGIAVDGPFVLDGREYYTREDALYMFMDGSLLYTNYDCGFAIETFESIQEAKDHEMIRDRPYW